MDLVIFFLWNLPKGTKVKISKKRRLARTIRVTLMNWIMLKKISANVLIVSRLVLVQITRRCLQSLLLLLLELVVVERKTIQRNLIMQGRKNNNYKKIEILVISDKVEIKILQTKTISTPNSNITTFRIIAKVKKDGVVKKEMKVTVVRKAMTEN